MTARPPRAARLATWWVGRYTCTAPPGAGADRRAEMRSDVHEQLSDARARRLPLRQVSRSITSRVLRGVPADIGWRLQVERTPGRLEWHLGHPSTVLGALFALLVPNALMLDAAHGPAPGLAVVQGVLAVSLALIGSCAVSFAVVAFVRRLAMRPLRPRDLGLGPLRRAAMCWMCALWAAAALWRFFPEPLGAVSAVAWGAFGVALLVYGASVLGSAMQRLLDFRKVPS